jgi:hypothetical protein
MKNGILLTSIETLDVKNPSIHRSVCLVFNEVATQCNLWGEFNFVLTGYYNHYFTSETVLSSV